MPLESMADVKKALKTAIGKLQKVWNFFVLILFRFRFLFHISTTLQLVNNEQEVSSSETESCIFAVSAFRDYVAIRVECGVERTTLVLYF